MSEEFTLILTVSLIFILPTYASGSARSEMIPGSMRIVDPLAMNGMWERRLDKYLLRKKAIEQTVVKV